VSIAAGLIERDGDRLHNAYVVVSPDGVVAKFRKLHPFISPHLTPGEGYVVFEHLGCRFGILICYDNNLPENVRATAMLGAEVVLMPHVTCGTESAMPGRGTIDRAVWENRCRDPVRCRQEFLGPKGRQWLMRWLPCRAYENGVYAVFANAIGIDHDTVKTGNAMVLDPFGEVLVESNALEDDVVVGLLAPEKIAVSSGRRYLRARRPELYGPLVEPLPAGERPVTSPGWRLERPPDST
jgi:predicted amidohydrolase